MRKNAVLNKSDKLTEIDGKSDCFIFDPAQISAFINATTINTIALKCFKDNSNIF